MRMRVIGAIFGMIIGFLVVGFCSKINAPFSLLTKGDIAICLLLGAILGAYVLDGNKGAQK